MGMQVWKVGVRMKPEAAVLRACLDYLAAKHVLAFRMNTGAVKIDKRFLRFGVPGMADILAFPVERNGNAFFARCPLWIECKAEKGRQSDVQKSFQLLVEEHNHDYRIVRSIEDLQKVLDTAHG